MNSEVIAALLAHYKIGRFEQIEPLYSDAGATFYKLQTTENTFTVKSKNNFTKFYLQNFPNLISVLQKNNFPGNFPIKSNSGFIAVEIENNWYELYPFSAAQPGTGTEIELLQLTESIAKLGLIEIEKPANNQTLYNQIIEFANALPNDVYNIKEVLLEGIEAFNYLQNLSIPTGLVHGNINNNKILFENNVLTEFTEFDTISIDRLLIDLSLVINSYCYSKNRLNSKLLQLILAKYNSTRKLSFIELSNLPSFIQYAAFIQLVTLVKTHSETEPNKKTIQQTAELRERFNSQTIQNKAKSEICHIVKQWVGFEFQ